MKPLEGVRIVELARVLAAPWADMILAELGAEVIKVEQPGRGDETRGFEPRVGDESAYFFAANRSKRSITVDLSTAAGQGVVHRLAASADVVVENFPAGSLARYGLDGPTLCAAYPRLIYVSCTGFGQDGPGAGRKGYDTVFQAMGGIMGLTGEKGGGPVKPGLPWADLTSGLWLAVAVLAALMGREQTGAGAVVDFGMLDGQVALLTLAAARWFALGEVPARLGTEHPGRVPSATFRCGDGGYVHITASDQHWGPLCSVLGLDQAGADPDLAANAERVARRDEVMAMLTDAVARLDRDDLLTRCEALGVPAGPVLEVDEILEHPLVLSRGMVDQFDHPTVGSFGALGVPLRFDGFDDPEVGRPPLLGEHTDEVLAELGYDAAEIVALRDAGAL